MSNVLDVVDQAVVRGRGRRLQSLVALSLFVGAVVGVPPGATGRPIASDAAPAGMATANSTAVAGSFTKSSYWTNRPFIFVQIAPAKSIEYVASARSGVAILRRANGTIAASAQVSGFKRPSVALQLAAPEAFDGTLEFTGDEQVLPIVQAVHVRAIPSSTVPLFVDSPSPGTIVLQWPAGTAGTSAVIVTPTGTPVPPSSFDAAAGTATFALPPGVEGELDFEASVQRNFEDTPQSGIWPDRSARPVRANARPSPGLRIIYGFPRPRTPIVWSVEQGSAAVPAGSSVDLTIDGTLRGSGEATGRLDLDLAMGEHLVELRLHSGGGWNDSFQVQVIDVEPASHWLLWHTSPSGVSAQVRQDDFPAYVVGTYSLETPTFVGEQPVDATVSSTGPTGASAPWPLADGHYRISWRSDNYPYTVDPVEFWVVDGHSQPTAPSPTPGGSVALWYQTTGPAPPGDVGTSTLLSCTRTDGTTIAWVVPFASTGSHATVRDLGLANGTCELSVDRGAYPNATSVTMQAGTTSITDEGRSTATTVRSARSS